MRFSLKRSITAARVCFRFGILTPSFGALAAIPIMFLNAVCSNAWMGYAGHEHGIREEILNTHLISCNQPVNSCLTETRIRIWNNRLALTKMRVELLLQFLRVFDLTAPKRSSKFFDRWVRDLDRKINHLIHDNRSIIFSDGAFWSKSSRVSYAFTAHHNRSWHDISGWCPAGSSFDAEIAALEEAIQWVVVRRIPDPVFFIDNKSVLTSFLDLDTHSSQMASIRINILLHDYFSTMPPSSTISFAYCPSHVGIAGNERADKLTKTGAALGPAVPIKILRSNFLTEFKQDMSKHWRILARSQTYKGHGWIPIKRKRRLFKPDVGNKLARHFFLTLVANDIETTSRMARALTNHAPTGEYRRRFHPEEPSHCKFCGPGVEHSQSHVFFSCPSYAPLAPSFTDWKKDRHNDKSWKTFFQENPSAFTFSDLPEDVH